jgi:hypothetical protein
MAGTDLQRTPPLQVRVIDYTIEDGRENPDSYRLLATILGPGRGHRRGPRHHLLRTVGNRVHLRRTENTSAWAEDSSAFQVHRPSGVTPSSTSSNASTRPAENAPSWRVAGVGTCSPPRWYLFSGEVVLTANRGSPPAPPGVAIPSGSCRFGRGRRAVCACRCARG